MVKTRTVERLNQSPVRMKRFVKQYQKKLPNNKRVRVNEYLQGYNVPRGPIRSVKPDRLTRYSQTMWLMDRYGHFIGRANFEGKTTATNIVRSGFDETNVIRDTKKYKRVFGRLRQKEKKFSYR